MPFEAAVAIAGTTGRGHEVEHAVADHAGGCKQPLGFLNCDDTRQMPSPERLDQTGLEPGLAHDLGSVSAGLSSRSRTKSTPHKRGRHRAEWLMEP